MAGDTGVAVRARLREVSTDPDDIMRRVRIAQVMDELGRPEAAVELLEAGVERMGDDVELRRLLVRMCMRYEMWTCAQENMSTLYALDSTLVGDTTFYIQMIGLAQARAETDVALQWTEEAMRQVDSLIDVAWERVESQRRAARRVEQVLSRLRMTHATTLLEVGRKDSALAVYREILEDDPGNVRAALALARLVTGGRTFGPGALTPADSEALATADSLLERVMAVSEDSATLQTVGVSYLDVGGRLVQNRNAASTAAEWLEKALGADPNGTLAARANAMLAVAIAFLVEETYEQLRTEPSCELVAIEVALIDRGMAAVSGALAEFPESSMDVGDGLHEYTDLITRVSEALACDIRGP
jgi:predicted Zn-dependent protease